VGGVILFILGLSFPLLLAERGGGAGAATESIEAAGAPALRNDRDEVEAGTGFDIFPELL